MGRTPAEVARAFHDRVIVANDWDAARELLHPQVRHLRGAIGLTITALDADGAAAYRDLAGPDRFIAATQHLRSLFDRWDSRIEVLVADDPYVFTRCLVRGRLARSLRGGPAGVEFALPQAVLQRVEDGRITEIWALSDQLPLWRELGAGTLA